MQIIGACFRNQMRGYGFSGIVLHFGTHLASVAKIPKCIQSIDKAPTHTYMHMEFCIWRRKLN